MINLLPSKQKQELAFRKMKRLLIILAFIWGVFLIGLGLTLYSVNIYVQGQLEYLESLVASKEQQKSPEIRSIQGKFKNYNRNLSKINSFYQEQISVGQVLNKMAQVLPSEVYLTSFSYQKILPKKKAKKEQYLAQISISGYSPTRRTLVQILENFRQQEQWKDVHFPESNWVEPTDINFTVSFKIKQGVRTKK